MLTIVAAAVVGWRSSPLGRRSSDWPIGDLDAICILDAGNNGVISKASHVLAKNGNDKHDVRAGPQAHWAKVAFEQVFIGSRKRGVLALKTRIARETHEQH